jgi:hypothetical protein
MRVEEYRLNKPSQQFKKKKVNSNTDFLKCSCSPPTHIECVWKLTPKILEVATLIESMSVPCDESNLTLLFQERRF